MKENKTALKGILAFIYYYAFNNLITLPIALIGINFDTLDTNIKILYLVIMEIIFIISLFFIFKEIITHLKEFVKNFITFVKEYFKYWPLAYGLLIICNIILLLIMPNNTPNNQDIINNIFSSTPIYMIVAAVVFAPIVEELIFRLSIRKMFKNDTIFIVISGLMFGSFHVLGSFDSAIDLLYIIPYSIPGFVFAYTFVKSKNIFVPTFLHFVHNGFTMLLQVIIMVLL